jgi:hypothetical protein
MPARKTSKDNVSRILALLNALAITDTSNHFTNVFYPTWGKRLTFVARSSLNQSVTMRLFGSKDDGLTSSTFTNGYQITGSGGAITLPADITVGANPGWVLIGTFSDYHPYLQWRIVAGVAPGSGTIEVWVFEGN